MTVDLNELRRRAQIAYPMLTDAGVAAVTEFTKATLADFDTTAADALPGLLVAVHLLTNGGYQIPHDAIGGILAFLAATSLLASPQTRPPDPQTRPPDPHVDDETPFSGV